MISIFYGEPYTVLMISCVDSSAIELRMLPEKTDEYWPI